MTTDIDIKLHFVQTYFPFIFRFHGPILKYFLSKSGQLLICFSPPCRQAFSRTLQISQNSTASLHRSCYPAGNTGLSADIFSWMGGNGNENNKYVSNQTTMKSFMSRGMTLKSSYAQLAVFCVPDRLCTSFWHSDMDIINALSRLGLFWVVAFPFCGKYQNI